MPARCQISMLSEWENQLPYSITLRFPTDSTGLSSLKRALVPTHPVNGLGRAFTKVPAQSKMFHSEDAARRDL
jgi:hypothetical protein